MNAPDSWMPVYVAEHLANTTHLTVQEHGAYFLLMLTYWRSGPLPDDDKALATIARADRKLWINEIGPTIREFFTAIDGKLYLKSLDIEIAFAEVNSAKKSAAAHAKWAKSRSEDASSGDPPAGANADARASAHAHARADAEQMHTVCPSPLPLPRKEEREKEPPLRGPPGPQPTAAPSARPTQGCRLPGDWDPGAEGRKFALSLGITAPEQTFAKFCDYWRAKTGQAATKLDWNATWRNWCRSEVERRPRAPIARQPSQPQQFRNGFLAMIATDGLAENDDELPRLSHARH